MGVHSGIMGGVARYDQSCSNPLSKSHIMLYRANAEDAKIPRHESPTSCI